MSEVRAQRRLAAILAADIAGYSRLMGADEEGTLNRVKQIRREVVDPMTAEHRGRMVKTTGDGALVEFASAVDAVRCALAVQARMAAQNAGKPGAEIIEFRIGINVGDIIIDEDDIYGDGVNVAARLEGLAEPGGIFVSRAVRDQVRDKLEAAFEDLGEQTVKNIARPVRVFRVAGPDAAKPAADPDGVLTLPDRPSIAVLPFNNMSGDAEQEYFADGIAEDIITSLSKLRGFFVIARNSTFTYKGRAVDIQAVARDLGVRYVLEGSVRKAANRVRVTAQLIDGGSGNHVWAERYDRQLEDIFAVQDEITETIVAAMEPQLHVAEIIRAQHKTPSSLDAWDLVLQALDRISRFSEEDSRAAVSLLDRAIAADPTYARAYAHRGWVSIWRAFQGWDPMGPAIAAASESVARGMHLDADEPWTYITRTLVCAARREGAEAIAAARRAVELNLNFAYGYAVLGAAQALAGDGEAALGALARAVRLSPKDLMRDDFDLFYSFAYFQMGDYAKASRHAAEAATLRPGHVFPNIMLAVSSGLAGEGQRAAAGLERAVALVPSLGLEMAVAQSPFVRDEERARFGDGLQRAGLTG